MVAMETYINADHAIMTCLTGKTYFRLVSSTAKGEVLL
jgi:hypothetical protein